MATPDGAPVAWMLRKQGFAGQPRISGPDLMWALCERCAAERLPVFFYGSTEATLAALDVRLRAAFPDLLIGGLGCPKQETWMAEHRGRVNAVMIGVGAAFDFHAGVVTRAPAWMRNNGLEWLHRLASDPRRLWRRYLVTNTLFILGAARQLWLGGKARR